MRKFASLATALIVLIMLFGLVPLLPQPAQAHPDPWWDANWQYRMPINITENSGSTLTNYQVLITLNTTTFNYSKANASGNDIRFATDGTQCDYWIETWNASGQSKLWAEVPSLPASSTTTIYMYYGNSGASAGTSYDNTFTKSFGESGLAGLWHMDEGSGSTTADSSGNGNNGTLSGATWVASDGGQWDGRSGVSFSTGKSLSFDGSNDKVTVNTSSSLNITGDITIAVWIKPDTRPSGCSYGDYEVLVSKRRSNSFTTNYQIYLENDGRKFSYWDGSKKTGSFIPPTGSWSYLVAVVNDSASQVKLYANGTLQDTLTGNTGAANNYALCIGGAVQSYTCNEPFHGIIDEVRIYNRALSQAEIQRYYQWSKYAPTEPTVNLGQEESSTSPPTVGEPVVTASMTPQSQAWVNVTITDNNNLSDLSNVTTVLFYDADGSYTDPGASPTPATQTLAIMTWYASNNTFTIQSGSPSTWSINNTTSTHPALTGTTGDWKFSFQPGKVATETTSSAKWFARVNATDSANLVGSNHTTTGSDMNWYGEITVGTSNISWGTVSPGCSNNISPVVNITYICNGNYSEQVKTSQNWTSASGNVTLNTTGSPGAGEFSLKADDDDTIADAVQVLSASYTTFDSGTQTTEAGNVENNNHLWLSLGLGIPVDTYSGTIYFGIA